jgi:hypothetical protein
MAEVSMTSQIRPLAMALPEVTEKQHHLFKVPVWQVRGRTFVGMGHDEITAVFCIAEESANVSAMTDPEHAAAVRRKDARRTSSVLKSSLPGSRSSESRRWCERLGLPKPRGCW